MPLTMGRPGGQVRLLCILGRYYMMGVHGATGTRNCFSFLFKMFNLKPLTTIFINSFLYLTTGSQKGLRFAVSYYPPIHLNSRIYLAPQSPPPLSAVHITNSLLLHRESKPFSKSSFILLFLIQFPQDHILKNV